MDRSRHPVAATALPWHCICRTGVPLFLRHCPRPAMASCTTMRGLRYTRCVVSIEEANLGEDRVNDQVITLPRDQLSNMIQC
jgi:hypothetical protein